MARTKGLHKKATFNEIIDEIVNPKDKIIFPNRFAKQLRNSFELSQLDGEGMRQMEMQSVNVMKEQRKEHVLQKIAMYNNIDRSDLSSLLASGTHEFHMPPISKNYSKH